MLLAENIQWEHILAVQLMDYQSFNKFLACIVRP